MFKNKVKNALALAILLYERESWTFRKKIKEIDIMTDENFQKNSDVHPFYPQK
jgi:hypothetical protein